MDQILTGNPIATAEHFFKPGGQPFVLPAWVRRTPKGTFLSPERYSLAMREHGLRELLRVPKGVDGRKRRLERRNESPRFNAALPRRHVPQDGRTGSVR